MRAMGPRVVSVSPRADRRDRHDRRYRVFLELYDDQRRYRAIETGAGDQGRVVS